MGIVRTALSPIENTCQLGSFALGFAGVVAAKNIPIHLFHKAKPVLEAAGAFTLLPKITVLPKIRGWILNPKKSEVELKINRYILNSITPIFRFFTTAPKSSTLGKAVVQVTYCLLNALFLDMIASLFAKKNEPNLVTRVVKRGAGFFGYSVETEPTLRIPERINTTKDKEGGEQSV